MSVSSSNGISQGDVNATSITASNFYNNGTGSFYMTNTGLNDDAIFGTAPGYSFLDTHGTFQIRTGLNGTVNDTLVITSNNVPGNANIGGQISMLCKGNNGAGIATNTRPTIANYNAMTNYPPAQPEIMTYYDYQQIRGLINNTSTIANTAYSSNLGLTSGVPTQVGALTIPTAGLYSININASYLASGAFVLFTLQITNLPAPYATPQTVYSVGIPVEDPTYTIPAEEQITNTLIVYFPGNTTINITALSSFTSGGFTFNSTARFPGSYFHAIKLG